MVEGGGGGDRRGGVRQEVLRGHEHEWVSLSLYLCILLSLSLYLCILLSLSLYPCISCLSLRTLASPVPLFVPLHLLSLSLYPCILLSLSLYPCISCLSLLTLASPVSLFVPLHSPVPLFVPSHSPVPLFVPFHSPVPLFVPLHSPVPLFVPLHPPVSHFVPLHSSVSHFVPLHFLSFSLYLCISCLSLFVLLHLLYFSENASTRMAPSPSIFTPLLSISHPSPPLQSLIPSLPPPPQSLTPSPPPTISHPLPPPQSLPPPTIFHFFLIDRVASISGLGITHEEFKEKIGLAEEYCPVSLVEDQTYIDASMDSTITYAAEFNGGSPSEVSTKFGVFRRVSGFLGVFIGFFIGVF